MKSDPSQLDMRKSVEVQVDSDFALLLPSGAYEIKKMEPRRRLRSIVFICLMLAIAGIIGFGYFCPDQVSAPLFAFFLCAPLFQYAFQKRQLYFLYLCGVWEKVSVFIF